MSLDLIVVGLNHRSAGVDVRERFALSPACLDTELCLQTRGSSDAPDFYLAESIVLSTCNRVEIIAFGQGDLAAWIHEKWAQAKHEDIASLIPYTYVYTGIEAIKHVFTVASSLDSMVLGEPQILGQLKEAFRLAVQAKTTGPVLNRLLHKSFSVAKRVRTETAIAANAVSISYAAVELAKRIFNDLREHSALLIGAGEMAELAATHLLQAGIKHLYITNRTFERARLLAEHLQGEAIAFEAMSETLKHVDIVISSTGAPEPILCAADVQDILPYRLGRPMFCIDIAVPRDIAVDVNTLDDIYVYDIDDLKEVVEENLAGRRDEASKAIGIVHQEVVHFELWLQALALQPTIVDVVGHFEQIVADVFSQFDKHLALLDATKQISLQQVRHQLIRKLAHDPLIYLKRSHEAHDARHVDITRRMFNLDKDRSERR